jgi:hypothetical protein
MRDDGVYGTRCKITYTQHDLVTGIEKDIKHTAQSRFRDMLFGQDVSLRNVEKLAEKINKWQNKNPTNFISKMNRINCKSGNLYIHHLWKWEREVRWDKYEECDNRGNNWLIDNLDNPNKLGYNANTKGMAENFPTDSKYCVSYMGDDFNKQ